MYGDHSRGHEPDRKRGRDYRRVLLQMGRPLLDSDVAALVDAMLDEVRTATRGGSGAAGSPDLGFLVTPGRLLSVFCEAYDEITAVGAPEAWLDYRYRFADRYPALRVAAPGAVAGVRLPALQPIDRQDGVGRAALWARVEAPTTVFVNGVAVALAPDSSGGPRRFPFETGTRTMDPLEVTVAAGGEAWLFLLEQDEAAGSHPAFWVAPGTYHVDGLVAKSSAGGRFPATSFPEDAGFRWSGSASTVPSQGLVAPPGLASGTRLVAYLETWERHITAVEDPGIREEALGATDTSTRTELVGQVKLATLDTGLTAEAEPVRTAFGTVVPSGGLLTVKVPEGVPPTDPCALPDPGGYTGVDNRLYRMEVHRGGPLAQLQLKWSRDNASELFAVRLDSSGNLVLDAGTALTAGDLVEVLSHVVDLGDSELASVGTDGIVPAARSVGQLAQLAPVSLESSTDEVVFRLVDPYDSATPVSLDGRYGDREQAGLKLRRWHGFLDIQRVAGEGGPSAGPHVIEDGITLELSSTGTYRPGQWWQYEARAGDANANGPWRPLPHGPERTFAPLALLEYQAADKPLTLVAWLDERFSPPADTEADGIAFAGERVGSSSDTVQEALEELFERPLRDSPCTVTVAPGDDLEEALAKLPAEGGQLCFEAGTYELDAPLTFRGRTNVVVHGAGPATVLRAAHSESVLVFEDCTDVAVRSLRAHSGVAPSRDKRAELNGTVTFTGGGRVSVSDCVLVCADAYANQQGYVHRTQTCLTARGGDQPLRVRLEHNRFETGHLQTGVLVVDAEHAVVAGNDICVSGVRDLSTGRIVDQGVVVAGTSAGTVEIMDNLVEDCIQGIHVATAGPPEGREAAEEVLLSRNVVHARVPAGHTRERHAVFVGNARSVHVKDTVATLERLGSGARTPVDGIRLRGVFGPFVAVHQTSTRDFTVGVHVEADEPVPSPRMWMVGETMAEGGELGAVLPSSVEAERNYPERRTVAVLSLVPLTAPRSVGTKHQITATARDAAGLPIAGVAIHFTVSGANKLGDQVAVTNSQGVAVLSYTGTKPGLDTVTAYADSNGNGRQDANELPTIATVNYVDLAPTSVVLTQNTPQSLRGSTTVVTATVRNGSNAPLPDVHVVFSVAGANPQTAETVATNANGQAVFSYTGQNAGTDTISAFADTNRNGQRDTNEPEAKPATHVYDVPVPAAISLLPTSGNAVVGSQVAYTATVLDAANKPLSGQTVRFVVTGQNPQSLSGDTTANGTFTFKYAGTKAGTDLIEVFADTDKDATRDTGEPAATATQTFTSAAPEYRSVPNLLGMTESVAKETITTAGLTVGAITRLPDPPKDPYGGYKQILRGPFVVDQSPSASTLAPQGSAVKIWLQKEWFDFGSGSLLTDADRRAGRLEP